jgi:hypothetical protein
MRRDGDRLVEHLSGAISDVLICAPFIKVGVLSKLLAAIPERVPVRVITRWLPKEVAAGVSDVEVFDIIAGRPGTSLSLLDRLHAKIYVADDAALIGSANLTGAALGWAGSPNLELLVRVRLDTEDVRQCLSALVEARPATAEERDRVREESLAFPKLDLAEDAKEDARTSMWLPLLGAPQRLYQAYVPASRERLSSSVLESALEDLDALGVPPGLSELEFKDAVAEAFRAMPAVQRLLEAAEDDLDDERAIELITKMRVAGNLTPEQLWLMVREWMTFFLADRYEIAPASFIIRRKPGKRA